MKKRIALLLSVAMCATLCLSGCGSSEKKTGDKKDASSMVYAVEQGSAGEEAAKSKGWSTNPVQSQAKALMEVNSGTSDAAIIDLLMAGITEFEPMDYKDEDGNWIGFDADLAKKLAEKLGVKIKFVVINWDTKTMELDSKKIDVVWNGMTLTNEVKNSMECTNAYCNNAQVVVVSSK